MLPEEKFPIANVETLNTYSPIEAQEDDAIVSMSRCAWFEPANRGWSLIARRDRHFLWGNHSAPSEAIILRKVLKPRLIAVFMSVVTVGIIAVGYLFNLVLS